MSLAEEARGSERDGKEESSAQFWSWSCRKRMGLIAALTALIAILHFTTPAGPHGLHWLHLLLQKSFYVPILMAAAWFGMRGTLATVLAVSLLFLVHILWSWQGRPMLQADQFGEIGSLWIIALMSSLLFGRVKRSLAEVATANAETLAALASSLDLREHKTALHSRRVQEYTLLLARRMGVKGGTALMNFGMGALLHDVGKIGVPDSILLKQGGLTEMEWREMRRHSDYGASLIGEIRFLEGARDIVASHHEKFDGTGYPKGLAGRSIPLGARIFAVVDVFDALTADRPYRVPLSCREAADQIAMQRGLHFDPEVVDAFLSIPFSELADVASRNGVILREA
ncbi:MAG: HD domain-containing protein [Deltaproteobacteria bacterium]|nr:HD domain-containing protein [Deltaproteobacteria bacterium]